MQVVEKKERETGIEPATSRVESQFQSCRAPDGNLLTFMTFRDLFPQVMLPAWESEPRLFIENICVNGVYSVHLHQWRFNDLQVSPA